MPVTIPPGEARSIVVATKMAKWEGTFTRTVGLQVDDEGLRRVRFRVVGRIKKATGESESGGK